METVRRNFQNFADKYGCDTEFFNLVVSHVPKAYLAGGAIRRVLLKQPLDSDFDFFFSDESHLKSWQDQLKGFTKERETAHHIQYKGFVEGSDLPVVIQAIKFKYYSSPEEVIDSFDFTITQFCLHGGYLHTTPEALWDAGRKKLVLHKMTYPVATMRRLLKYSNQGFTACSGCMSSLYQSTINNPETWEHLDIEYVD